MIMKITIIDMWGHMGGKFGIAETGGTSDTEKLYDLGLAQAVDQSVNLWLRGSFSIKVIALLLRCLALYGVGLEFQLSISFQ